MPQVDLETLVSSCAGGGSSMDRKIACETLADAGEKPQEEVPPDFPPESFWLSKDAELDWFDRNAFFERKESQKGNNSSNSTNLNPNIVPGSHSNSNSQRFSKNLKSKAAIIGLPKGQKSYAVVDSKSRKNSTARLFPKRPGPPSSGAGKSDSALAEPSSPKVSCMGRVRSKRDRKRRWRRKNQPEIAVAEKNRTGGFFASFKAIFRSGCREKPADRSSSRYTGVDLDRSDRSGDSPPQSARSAASTQAREFDAPPGLGGLQRFASGRKSSSMMDDVA